MDNDSYPVPGPHLPVLEIRLRVAQLGGWDKIEVLTPAAGTARLTPLKWMYVASVDVDSYLDAIQRDRDYWFIYDIRERRYG